MIVLRLFNMERKDYKRFLNFLQEARLSPALQGLPARRLAGTCFDLWLVDGPISASDSKRDNYMSRHR